ncbi:MAG: DUF2808 domain-containing protein [Aphanothece sp. CMT-3BRIN-NPC111]|nr:DUF2808 domain-containing protein [Aphanothece sp. CMT-3BRIN-NPC111]
MRLLTVFATTLTLAAEIVGIVGQSAHAIQLQDGTVWFEKSPSLIATTTTFNNTYVWGATYYFTLSLPENAGEPLQRVTITQIEGLDNIRYQLEDSYAFEGRRRDKGKKLTLGEVTRNRDNREVSVTFDPPVPPGKTVTIALRPVRNPFDDGIYLFGVKAFPAGEKAYGLNLGVGRLQFYRRGYIF